MGTETELVVQPEYMCIPILCSFKAAGHLFEEKVLVHTQNWRIVTGDKIVVGVIEREMSGAPPVLFKVSGDYEIRYHAGRNRPEKRV